MAPTDTIRVAIDATPLLGPVTGIGVSTQAIIARMATVDSLDVTGFVVSLRGRRSLAQALPAGVKPLAMNYSARASRTAWRYFDWPRLPAFDVIHGTNFVVPPSAGGVGLVTINDLTPWKYPELANRDTRRYPALVSRALARGAHVHTISNFVGAEVIELLGVPPDQVHPIPIGLEVAKPGDRNVGHRIAGSDSYLLAIGTIEPRKDYVSLLRAFELLVAEGHRDLKLVIIGGDGWGAEDFTRLLRSSIAADAVVRLGYVDERTKANVLAGARCLVYPSLYEGFGLPPLEAMAAGVPVVATAAGAVPEVVGEAAALVGVSDPQALARAIAEVISDPVLRQSLVSKGREQAKQFDWDRTTQRLVQLYHALADA